MRKTSMWDKKAGKQKEKLSTEPLCRSEGLKVSTQSDKKQKPQEEYYVVFLFTLFHKLSNYCPLLHPLYFLFILQMLLG